MYLLDTDIVFELRNAKSGGTDPGLAGWAGGVARASLFISALTLLELETGVGRAERRDKTHGLALRAWLDVQVAPAFDGRILPVDAAVVRRCAQLPHGGGRDALLAATALEHGLTLVTRNIAAFKATKVKLFNAWGYAPDAASEDEDWGQAAKAGSHWLKNIFVRG
ncbi:type II toxin-antitoxin system VapC family toxin [Caulobacter sp. DWR3-1-2]|uniref:type II toxin-antitoxin system VapC family toxin n=1 Tax=Caulobacter sp. DWR3-1-2 TaxID=2804647 RepID=UPI003CF7F367